MQQAFIYIWRDIRRLRDAGKFEGWSLRPIYWLENPGAADTQSGVWMLDGEGAYEGLTAVLVQEGFDTFYGFVIDGAPAGARHGQPAR